MNHIYTQISRGSTFAVRNFPFHFIYLHIYFSSHLFCYLVIPIHCQSFHRNCYYPFSEEPKKYFCFVHTKCRLVQTRDRILNNEFKGIRNPHIRSQHLMMKQVMRNYQSQSRRQSGGRSDKHVDDVWGHSRNTWLRDEFKKNGPV